MASPIDHVIDTKHWHFFESQHLELHLPFKLTKFMILLVLAALLVLAFFLPLARRVRDGSPPKGAWWNALESLLTFIRNEVAIPYIGEHDADRFVPFLWTLFLFILFNNLLGMFPFLGSPTSSITVTGVLALCSFVCIHGAAIAKMGPLHYLKSYAPHIDMPLVMRLPLVLAIVCIEMFGNVIKAVVLAVRLFANMFAGHTVLATILLFIPMASHADWFLFWPITIGSVLGVTALSLLELFVAFLQAYIFTFLTALFLGSTLHPEH